MCFFSCLFMLGEEGLIILNSTGELSRLCAQGSYLAVLSEPYSARKSYLVQIYVGKHLNLCTILEVSTLGLGISPKLHPDDFILNDLVVILSTLMQLPAVKLSFVLYQSPVFKTFSMIPHIISKHLNSKLGNSHTDLEASSTL